MIRADAISLLQALRQEAQAKAYPRSRLAIQEYMDAGPAADDVVALGMAIKALQAPARQRMPTWACVLWCVAMAALAAACVIYCL